MIAFGAFQKYTAWISRNVRHHHQEDRKGNPIQTMALNCMVKQVKSFIWLKEAGFEDRSLQSLTRSQTNLSTTKNISSPDSQARREEEMTCSEAGIWVLSFHLRYMFLITCLPCKYEPIFKWSSYDKFKHAFPVLVQTLADSGRLLEFVHCSALTTRICPTVWKRTSSYSVSLPSFVE